MVERYGATHTHRLKIVELRCSVQNFLRGDHDHLKETDRRMAVSTGTRARRKASKGLRNTDHFVQEVAHVAGDAALGHICTYTRLVSNTDNMTAFCKSSLIHMWGGQLTDRGARLGGATVRWAGGPVVSHRRPPRRRLRAKWRAVESVRRQGVPAASGWIHTATRRLGTNRPRGWGGAGVVGAR